MNRLHKSPALSDKCQQISCIQMGSILMQLHKEKSLPQKWEGIFHGDPYGNRTHVTAVKGRCLNRLTNGPGSGNLIRTDDIPGMNRLLYQLSYAAMWSKDFGTAEISSLIIPIRLLFVKKNF